MKKSWKNLLDCDSKRHKVCVIKEIKFEAYQIIFKEAQLENKINHFEKNKVSLDSLKKDHNL